MAKNRYLVRAIEQRQAKTAVVQNLQDEAASQDRELSDDERKTFDELVAEIKRLDSEIARISEADSAAAKFLELIGAQKAAEEKAERAHDDAGRSGGDDAGGGSTPEGRGRVRADFGRQFVESTAFKNFRGRGTSDSVVFPGVASPEFREAIRTDTWDNVPEPFHWNQPAEATLRNPFLDMLGRVQVGSGAVTYMRWGAVTDAELVAEGELKPEADLALTEGATTLDTYAHWKAITRQALEDIPQIQSILQNKLLLGVRQKLEAVATDVYNNDPDIATVDAADILSAMRVTLGMVEANGYQATAFLLNPADAADLDLAIMQGTVAGPVRYGSAFGKQVVTSNSQPAGSVGTADFKTALTWFDRNVLAAYLTDSHADYFLRNQLVMLAETRAVFVVTEPQAAAIGTFPTSGS